MMYPRLKLARNLLCEKGIIFISINDNEVKNLRKICDEIFGEDNFIAEFIWKKTSNPNSTKNNVGISHEYIISYSKNFTILNLIPLDNEKLEKYKGHDEFEKIRGPYKLVGLNKTGTVSDRRPNLEYDIIAPDNSIIKPNPRWRWSKEKLEKGKMEKRVIFKKNKNNWNVYYKQYLNEDNKGNRIERGNLIPTILDSWGRTTNGSLEVNSIIGKGIFDFPKPIKLIKLLIKIATSEDSIIMDFFSGSGTSAHSMIELNSEDNGNRKFIMVQIPEPTDEKSEAYKAGYKNICEIGKERIRRAGDKILEESDNKDLDIGFKVFKLDSSNIQKWDPDYNNLTESLDKFTDNIKEDRTEEDLVYEIMLKYGIDLTLPIQKENIKNHTIYSIGYGALLICLDDDITKDITKPIIDLSKDSISTRVVFKDNGFKSDSDKTNIKETLKVNNIEEFITI